MGNPVGSLVLIDREKVLSMDRRVKKLIIGWLIVIAVGIGYYFIVRHLGVGIPCYIYASTGKKCPGCGLTRMVMHLTHFQFKEAFMDNQLMFVLWPFIVAEIVYILVRYCRDEKIPKWNLALIYTYAGLAIAFMFVRNAFGL